jgi:hypothetical protein
MTICACHHGYCIHVPPCTWSSDWLFQIQRYKLPERSYWSLQCPQRSPFPLQAVPVLPWGALCQTQSMTRITPAVWLSLAAQQLNRSTTGRFQPLAHHNAQAGTVDLFEFMWNIVSCTDIPASECDNSARGVRSEHLRWLGEYSEGEDTGLSMSSAA